MQKINTIIFDLGGVLIDWNPRYLYRKIFQKEEEVSWFLENICTMEWNVEQDAGRSFAEATELLVSRHPEYEEPIRAYYGRFHESFNGPIHDTVEILRQIKEKKHHKLLALTNWSAEGWSFALDTFPFLQWFEGIVVSGQEKTRKPFPEIYELLCKRYSVSPEEAVFIDDNPENVEGANKCGITGIHFKSPATLKQDLTRLGII